MREEEKKRDYSQRINFIAPAAASTPPLSPFLPTQVRPDLSFCSILLTHIRAHLVLNSARCLPTFFPHMYSFVYCTGRYGTTTDTGSAILLSYPSEKFHLSSRIALVYQSFYCRTIADRLHNDQIAGKNMDGYLMYLLVFLLKVDYKKTENRCSFRE